MTNRISQNESGATHRPKQILALSELLLSVKDINGNRKNAGPAGDPSYPDRLGKVVYHPTGGVLIEDSQTRNQVFELELDDLVLLDHGRGYVEVEDFFEAIKRGWIRLQTLQIEPDGGVVLSSEQLSSAFAQYEGLVNHVIEKIQYLAEIHGVNHKSDFDLQAINKASKMNREFTPSDIISSARAIVTANLSELGLYTESIIQQAEYAGTFELDPEKQKEGLLRFFHLFCDAQKVNRENPTSLFRAIQEFRYWEELLQQYQDNPGMDFSDAELVALSMFHSDVKAQNAD